MHKRTIFALMLVAILLIAPACKNEDEALSTDSDEPSTLLQEAAPVLPSDPGPCNNILFPLSDGNNWVYEVDSIDPSGNPAKDQYAWTVSGQDGNQVTLGTKYYESGMELSADITCEDGEVQNFPLTVSSIAMGDMAGAVTYEHISGKYLPSAAELESGNWENAWQTVINSSGTITTNYGGETMTIELANSPITMNWQVIAKDVSVTVPAGSFDNAVQVSQELIYQINSMKINTGDVPMEISATMTFNSDYWFVPNIGLVKTEIKSSNVEMLGSQFPIDMTSGSVLISSNLLD